MIRVRFAVPPRNSLLLGGLRVALANDLFVRRGKGEMLLRLDDLDNDRTRSLTGPATAGEIEHDLHWFGIHWHTLCRQSTRLALYRDAIARLERDSLIYPCFETEEELKAKLEFRRKRNQPPIYDRAMLSLTGKQRQDAEAGGKRPHWRLKLSGRTLEWHDLVLGNRRVTLSTVSDPILVRADDSPTPLLASVVDDIDYGTTHLIRSEDNTGNTGVQIELFEVLRGTRPDIRFAHLPALQDIGGPVASGRKASNLTVRGLRADGVEPYAIAACLLSDRPVTSPALSLDALAARFDLGSLARSGFDIAAMMTLNRTILRDMTFAAVADRLPPGATEAFWLAVRGSLDLLKEARLWWDVVSGSIIPPVIEGARELLLTANSLLPLEPWDAATWANWVAGVEQATGRTTEMVIAALRLALTGEDSGPELAALLPLIGRARAASRLIIAAK